MAAATWNFPCWRLRDRGPFHGLNARGGGGNAFSTGLASGAELFTTEITAIGAFLISSEYTSRYSDYQIITSFGNASSRKFDIWFERNGNSPQLVIRIRDSSGGTQRYNWTIKDDDGTTGKLIPDKWYQLAMSANASGLVVVVNGETAPTITKTTTTPGALNLGGTPRWWHAGADSAWGTTTNQDVVAQGAASVILGPWAFHNGYIDLTSQTVRDRIFDENGDFKNPGDGSLWFGSTYGASQPRFYFPDGVPRVRGGSDTSTTFIHDCDFGSNSTSCPGGLRKQWELATPIEQSINTSLEAFYPLSRNNYSPGTDLSGNSRTLTDNNTVGNGGNGSARVDLTLAGSNESTCTFTAANSEFLDRASAEPSIWTPDTSFTMATIFYFNTNADQTLASVVGATGSEYSWRLWRRASDGTIRFSVSANGDVADVVEVASAEGAATGQWAHVIAWFDSVNDVIGIWANGTEYKTTAFAGPVFDAAVPFAIGCIDPDGTASGFMNGNINQFWFWSRTLTRNEMDYLYNSRYGRDWETS